MKKHFRFLILTFITVGFVFVLMDGCSKKDDSSSTQNGILFNSKLTYGSVTDVDGNVYKTITIGNQTWMAENLRVLHYRNGDTIPGITDATKWAQRIKGAYCDYLNDASKAAIYGKLYNWLTIIDTRNVCPAGWHVPVDAEWETLYTTLGGYQTTTSDKMREVGITHWAYINDGASNACGFTAIPGGMRDFGGIFFDVGQTGFWWSATPSGDYYQQEADYYFLDSGVNSGSGSRLNGLSIRCVKD